MDISQKQQFQASNLSTINQGALEVTVIPALNQTDWIVPKVLIIHEENCQSNLSSFKWQDETIAVYDLTTSKKKPNTLVILEGSTKQQRVGLLFKGSLKTLQIKISEIKDIESTQSTTKKERTPFIFQEVTVNNQVYIVPDLEALVNHLDNVKSKK